MSIIKTMFLINTKAIFYDAKGIDDIIEKH